jgi:uncharacterized protein (TIGR03083 family)
VWAEPASVCEAVPAGRSWSALDVRTGERFGPKIDARDEFEQDRAALLQLLRQMCPGDWERPTAAAPWVVRDVVAHLLGDDVGRLARTRDGHRVGAPGSDETLAAFIHRLNEQWVRAASRISPSVLIDMLEVTTPQVLDLWRGTDLDAVGKPVSWAGPDPAPVWLDCARDFTEYWVHQQQIREAAGRSGGSDAKVVHAVLDTFLRAMPYTLAGQSRPAGSTLTVTVAGAGGDRWSWRREGERWWPSDHAGASTTSIVIEADVLWRLCVRMVEPKEAQEQVRVSGEHELATAALQIVSIIR